MADVPDEVAKLLVDTYFAQENKGKGWLERGRLAALAIAPAIEARERARLVKLIRDCAVYAGWTSPLVEAAFSRLAYALDQQEPSR